jgi:hypothetical protein
MRSMVVQPGACPNQMPGEIWVDDKGTVSKLWYKDIDTSLCHGFSSFLSSITYGSVSSYGF